MIIDKLKKALGELGVPDDQYVAEKFYEFMGLVLEKNKEINLTTITEDEEFVEKHLIDSVACYGWPEIEDATSIIDIGTGAGFPGIPLAILYPDKEFLLVDSLKKRIDFIDEVIRIMGLVNVRTLHRRAEDVGSDVKYRGKYDLCLTRAVAKLSVLLEYSIPVLKVGKFLYAYKGIKVKEEIESSEMARYLLGAEIIDVRKIEINDIRFDHSVIVIEKTRGTSGKYPRKAGIPNKVPL